MTDDDKTLASPRLCPKCALPVIAGVDVCPRDRTKLDSASPAGDQAQASPEGKRGRNVAERYEYVGSLGSGGMSTVYKARDMMLNRSVAIKQIIGEFVTEEMVLRFEREARAYAALNHPSIVSVFDYGMDENNKPFLVMDFVEGKQLDEITANGGDNLDLILEMFVQLLDGLSHAHRRAIVHRDLKPANVMIQGVDAASGPNSTANVTVKLMDFGIAKMGGSSQDKSAFLTQPGRVIGSPLYMSPEQAQADDVDARSDIYSVGCMLFEALTGRPPFRGKTAVKTMLAHRSEAIPKMEALVKYGDLGVELETIVRKALEKQPENRFETASKLRGALLDLQSRFRQRKSKQDNIEQIRVKRFARLEPLILTVAVILGVGAVCAFAYFGFNFVEDFAEKRGKVNIPIATSHKSEKHILADTGEDYWRDNTKSHSFNGKRLIDLSNRSEVVVIALGNGLPDVSKTYDKERKQNQNALLEGIEKLSNLNEVYLQKFDLSKSDLERLTALKPVTKLLIRYSKLPRDPIAILGQNPEFAERLSVLDLKGCDLGSQDLKSLPKFKNLTELGIGSNDLGNDSQVLVPVSQMEGLQNLSMDETHIKTVQLEPLLKLTSLKALNLNSNSALTNECFKTIAKMNWLTEIEMPNCPIGDEGVKSLVSLRGLQVLDISWTAVTDKSIDYIQDFPKLTYLKLQGCKISPQKLAMLKQKRPKLEIKYTTPAADLSNGFDEVYENNEANK